MLITTGVVPESWPKAVRRCRSGGEFAAKTMCRPRLRGTAGRAGDMPRPAGNLKRGVLRGVKGSGRCRQTSMS
jgi:hypothetical protein